MRDLAGPHTLRSYAFSVAQHLTEAAHCRSSPKGQKVPQFPHWRWRCFRQASVIEGVSSS